MSDTRSDQARIVVCAWCGGEYQKRDTSVAWADGKRYCAKCAYGK